MAQARRRRSGGAMITEREIQICPNDKSKSNGKTSVDAIFFIEHSVYGWRDLMRSSMRIILAGGLVAFGYLVGSAPMFGTAQAQPEVSAPSEDSIKKIGDANVALKAAALQLSTESRYASATKSVNSYAVLVGGINVKDDLENGHGVDPETFAALNVALYEIKKNNVNDDSLADWIDPNLFSYDSNGHLMYKNKVLRIYSISRLRKLNAQRMVVLGEVKDSKTSK